MRIHQREASCKVDAVFKQPPVVHREPDEQAGLPAANFRLYYAMLSLLQRSLGT